MAKKEEGELTRRLRELRERHAKLELEKRQRASLHHVTIRLEYYDTDHSIPWKRRGVCTCGWEALSWDGLRIILMADSHVHGRNSCA